MKSKEKIAKKMADKIAKHYKEHGVDIKIFGFEKYADRYIFDIRLGQGAKESSFFKRASDVRLSLQLPLFHPVKDGLKIRIAVSENEIFENNLMKILQNPKFLECTANMKIPYAMGYDVFGNAYIEDLAELFHLLIAAPTGGGKTTALICLILSIILNCSPNEVNLLLFDVGAFKLSAFNGVPHLSYPVVKDIDTAIVVSTSLVAEMERRIALREENELEFLKLPFIVCVIDEGVSLISNADKKQSQMLVKVMSDLLWKGRQAHISIVVATQDPTLKNIKFDLKNIISRIAFRCAKYQDSITILGEIGAENLTGKGTMYFKSAEHSGLKWLQGAYIKPDEIPAVLCKIASDCDCTNKFEITEKNAGQVQTESNDKPTRKSWAKFDRYKDNYENLLAEVIMWTLSNDYISTDAIKSKYQLGFERARPLLSKLEELNLITPPHGNAARKVILESIEDMKDDEIMAETLNILKRNDYFEDNIIEAISQRPSKTN